MSNEMNVQEMIEELDKIDALCNEIEAISEECENLVSVQNPKEMEEAGQNSIKILREYQETKKAELADVAQKLPVTFPSRPPRSLFERDAEFSESAVVGGAVSLLLIYLSIIGVILVGLFDLYLWPFFLLWGATFLVNYRFPISKALRYLKWYNSLDAYKESVREWESTFEKQYTDDINQKRYSAFRAYDKRFLSYVEDCKRKSGEENIRYKGELEAIKDRNTKKLKVLQDKRIALVTELTSTTLIPQDLYADAKKISSMLKQKRADSLKEAVNLVFEEKRKDREEAARRAEAERQARILEQQAYDNRMHNLAMERAAEQHNAAMERAAQAQADAAQAQADAAQAQAKATEQQAKAAKEAASARCANCANIAKCTVSARNALNCGGYRPR